MRCSGSDTTEEMAKEQLRAMVHGVVLKRYRLLSLRIAPPIILCATTHGQSRSQCTPVRITEIHAQMHYQHSIYRAKKAKQTATKASGSPQAICFILLLQLNANPLEIVLYRLY